MLLSKVPNIVGHSSRLQGYNRKGTHPCDKILWHPCLGNQEPSGLKIISYTSIVHNEYCVHSHVDCALTWKTRTICLNIGSVLRTNIGMLGSLSVEPSHPDRFTFYPNTCVRIRGFLCHLKVWHMGHIYTFSRPFKLLSQTLGQDIGTWMVTEHIIILIFLM